MSREKSIIRILAREPLTKVIKVRETVNQAFSFASVTGPVACAFYTSDDKIDAAHELLFTLQHMFGRTIGYIDTLANACWVAGIEDPAKVASIAKDLLEMPRGFSAIVDYTMIGDDMWLTYHGFITVCLIKLKDTCSCLSKAILNTKSYKVRDHEYSNITTSHRPIPAQ